MRIGDEVDVVFCGAGMLGAALQVLVLAKVLELVKPTQMYKVESSLTSW